VRGLFALAGQSRLERGRAADNLLVKHFRLNPSTPP